RQEEIAFLELVGATHSFVRRPFILEGLTLGLMASALSIVLSFLVHGMIRASLAEVGTGWIVTTNWPILSGWQLALNLGTGVLFGTLGAWVCVRRLNTGWSAAAS